MTTIHSADPSELLSPPEIRQKAMEILQRQGRNWSEVRKLVRREGDGYITIKQVAQRLGISNSKLNYMIARDYLREKKKQGKLAKKDAENIEFTSYTSSLLKFSISFPLEWRVTTDRINSESDSFTLDLDCTTFSKMFPNVSLEGRVSQKDIPAEEAYQKLLEEQRAKVVEFQIFEKAYKCDRRQAYRLFFKYPQEVPTDEYIEDLTSMEKSAMEAYNSLMENPETFLVSFSEFKGHYENDLEQRRQARERRARLEQMEEGFFNASYPNNENYLCADVTKLKLTEAINALELYKLDKPLPEDVPSGSRPSRGIIVDGLHGVKYFFIFDTGETNIQSDMTKFLNIYLAENDEGWIISCSCKAEVFNKYKPVFERIIGSFRRM